MKLVTSFLIALLVCTTAQSDSGSGSIIGAYELKLGKPGNSVEMVMECASETACTFSTVSQSIKSSYTDTQTLKNVVPVPNLTYANNALKYAIDQQSKTIKNEEFAEAMSRLRPVLSANPVITKCWDLNYPSRSYTLACQLSNTVVGAAPIYLFATLMANCHEAFCRYVIYPMPYRK